MKKVVILIEQPLDDRNYQRFGIQTWLERNWVVEVWDLTPWAHPRVWRSFIAYGNKIREFAGYFPVASGSELANRLSISDQTNYFVDLTGENYQSVRAKISLQRAGAIRIVCPGGTIPIPDKVDIGPMAKLAQVIAKGPRGSLRWLSSAFFHKVVGPRIATGFAVISGEQAIARVRNRGELIRTHNFDYDIYLALIKAPAVAATRYVVFIDQDYCFHPEYIYQSIPPLATPGKYFPAVRNGLKIISDALKVQVRIAAHPRATYQQRGLDVFGGFAVEYGRTAELIRDCEAVICHDSTAVQFAVLFGKPVMFVTTDELMGTYEGRSIVKIAAELGKSPVNLDCTDLLSVDWPKEMQVDAAKYERYRAKYIKTAGSPEIPLWDIVINYIESLDSSGSTSMREICID
jgi:hypothetical protein